MSGIDELWLESVGRPMDQGEVREEDLTRLWRALFTDESRQSRVGLDVFLETFMRGALGSEDASALAMRPGGWVLKVSAGAVKTAVMTALIAGLLAVTESTGLPTLVLPAVLPLLFDLERVRLSRAEGQVLAELVVHEDVRSGAHTPDQLYARLPQATRDQLSPLDFADFLDKCRTAGVADELADRGVRLRALGDARFRVTFL